MDALLMGRKTYEVMLASNQTSYPAANNYVFSRSAKKAAALERALASRQKRDRNVKVVVEDAAAFVKRLKSRSGKDIVVFGGGELAKSLLRADLIDEIVLNIQPVLIGSGIPLFPQLERQFDLERLDCRPLKNGAVVLTYRVVH